MCDSKLSERIVACAIWCPIWLESLNSLQNINTFLTPRDGSCHLGTRWCPNPSLRGPQTPSFHHILLKFRTVICKLFQFGRF